MRLLLCAIFIAMPAAANAQLAPGRSGISTQYSFSGQEAWDALSEFGACYAVSQQKEALKLVATPAGSIEEAKTYKELFKRPDQSCLGDISSLSVPWQLVRGAIAEGLYTRRIPLPANFAAAPVLPDNARNLSDIALCYTGRHPEAARALIEGTRPGTKKEAEAVGALIPDLADCLPSNLPKAPQFDTMLIRFRIAEALWRLGMVRGQASSSATATKANP